MAHAEIKAYDNFVGAKSFYNVQSAAKILNKMKY
jgi:hypothetical protein